jgi:hypothetical protein
MRSRSTRVLPSRPPVHLPAGRPSMLIRRDRRALTVVGIPAPQNARRALTRLLLRPGHATESPPAQPTPNAPRPRRHVVERGAVSHARVPSTSAELARDPARAEPAQSRDEHAGPISRRPSALGGRTRPPPPAPSRARTATTRPSWAGTSLTGLIESRSHVVTADPTPCLQRRRCGDPTERNDDEDPIAELAAR